MARRRKVLLAEGSDSNDSYASEDEDAKTSQPPSFVRASRAPAFVAASQNKDQSVNRTEVEKDDTTTANDETSLQTSQSDSEDAMDLSEDTPAFLRRSVGAGLGSKLSKAQTHTQDRTFEKAASNDKRPDPPPAPRQFLSTPSVPLSRTSGSGGFDPSAYLKQMGWTGGGLGKEGEGMVNPIEVQLRPNRSGVAFGGRREKTKQVRSEERRKTGALSSSDDEDHPDQRHSLKVHSSAWKRKPKQRKPTIVYRTYEEIVAEVDEPQTGPVLDATGEQVREVDSVAAALAKHPVPTSESAQLPELRHNLQLLCSGSRETLHKLAREGAAHRDRARWLDRDKHETQRRASQIDKEREMLRSVIDAVTRLSRTAQNAHKLEDLSADVDCLLGVQTNLPASVQLHLDEAVAGAMVPILRRILIDWDPLACPHLFTSTIAPWLPILHPQLSEQKQDTRVMTPYESVLWNVWMPKIRSTITSAWDVRDPATAIGFVEAWHDLLPAFLYDNLLDQLIVPRLARAVQHWSSKEPVALHIVLLPWLPIAEKRMDTVLAEAKRHWRSTLSQWRIQDGVPAELVHWRSVFNSKDWDALLLEKIVPTLSKAMRTQFVMNPADQDLSTLDSVLAWRNILRDSVFSRLLESEFGVPFLRTLHQWLTQVTLQYDEVAAWYTFWRQHLSTDVTQLVGLANVFTKALRLINQALDLGQDRQRLALPDLRPTSRHETRPTAIKTNKNPINPPPVLEDVSFRSIVEDAAREKDLFVLGQNQLEPITGLPLLRVASHIDGKHGVSFYLDDDVVFAATDHGDYEPISVIALLDRAGASR
ncbi:hypothetical protein MPSI1_001610 [Malassezia psittaci]|uniref:G-patch domain-containing protein n=1 Tax=Malassezia psittaci TaxID=1821823 RepID=A0AAF0JE21_9BASI|nr:hypothetical protein MPSI1_001610 [Malassezia psittaci]